jgi:hypothetical protein
MKPALGNNLTKFESAWSSIDEAIGLLELAYVGADTNLFNKIEEIIEILEGTRLSIDVNLIDPTKERLE